jgi:hypothetical protein
MQHAELVTGIKKVSEALEQSGLRDALAPGDNPDTELLLDALRRYAIAASSYTSAEETVADLLGLAELDSSSAWARLLSGGGARAHFHERIGFVTRHLPRFVELLEEAADVQRSAETFCVTVVGDGGLGITSDRLVTIVNSLTSLYRGCAQIDDLAPGELALVSCDAGSDTLLWFEGEAEVLGSVRALLTSAFRWLALYREQALEERIERARDELPAIEKLHQLVMEDAIDPEVASIVERDLLLGLLAFFDAGALIPEMEEDMARDPRDIVHIASTDDVAEVDDSGLEEVTAEIEQLDESLGPPPAEEVIELEPGSVEISDEESSARLAQVELVDGGTERISGDLLGVELIDAASDETAGDPADGLLVDGGTERIALEDLVEGAPDEGEPIDEAMDDDGVIEVLDEVVDLDDERLDVVDGEMSEIDEAPEIQTEGPWVD